MDTKIQELTEKLYLEGVEKGEQESERLIQEAQNRRKMMIDEAQEEAKEIVALAQKQADDLKKNTEAELKLYAAQAVDALKSEIANLLTTKLANTSVQSAFQHQDFMKELILKLAIEWNKTDKITIGTDDTTALQEYFNAKAKEILDNKVTIEQVSGKKHSFTIAPTDGSYKVHFGENEFIEYFKEFLRPQLIELLF